MVATISGEPTGAEFALSLKIVKSGTVNHRSLF
jgi:hypothetical protein